MSPSLFMVLWIECVLINDFKLQVWVHVSETAAKPIELRIIESVLRNKHSPSVEIEGLKLMFQYTFRV